MMQCGPDLLLSKDYRRQKEQGTQRSKRLKRKESKRTSSD